MASRLVTGEGLWAAWAYGVCFGNRECWRMMEVYLDQIKCNAGVGQIQKIADSLASLRGFPTPGKCTLADVARAIQMWPEERVVAVANWPDDGDTSAIEIPYSEFAKPQHCARLVIFYLAGELVPEDCHSLCRSAGLSSIYTALSIPAQGMPFRITSALEFEACLKRCKVS